MLFAKLWADADPHLATNAGLLTAIVGTVAGVIGTAVGILGLVFAFVTRKLGPPRRLIVYNVEFIPLVSEEWPSAAAAALKITHRGKLLADPCVVTLTVDSRGYGEISASDFDRSRPIIFDLGANIVAPPLEMSPDGEDSPISTPEPGHRSVQLLPRIIRRGRILTVQLLMDGKPKVAVRNVPSYTDVQDKAYEDRRATRRYRSAHGCSSAPTPNYRCPPLRLLRLPSYHWPSRNCNSRLLLSSLSRQTLDKLATSRPSARLSLTEARKSRTRPLIEGAD